MSRSKKTRTPFGRGRLRDEEDEVAFPRRENKGAAVLLDLMSLWCCSPTTSTLFGEHDVGTREWCARTWIRCGKLEKKILCGRNWVVVRFVVGEETQAGTWMWRDDGRGRLSFGDNGVEWDKFWWGTRGWGASGAARRVMLQKSGAEMSGSPELEHDEDGWDTPDLQI